MTSRQGQGHGGLGTWGHAGHVDMGTRGVWARGDMCPPLHQWKGAVRRGGSNMLPSLQLRLVPRLYDESEYLSPVVLYNGCLAIGDMGVPKPPTREAHKKARGANDMPAATSLCGGACAPGAGAQGGEGGDMHPQAPTSRFLARAMHVCPHGALVIIITRGACPPRWHGDMRPPRGPCALGGRDARLGTRAS